MSGNGGASEESFLPQIIGIFYAIFDNLDGPVVVHQIPEDLITTTHNDAGYNLPASLSSSTILSPPQHNDFGWPTEPTLISSANSTDDGDRERKDPTRRERDAFSPAFTSMSPIDVNQDDTSPTPLSPDALFLRDSRPNSPHLGFSNFPLSEPSILNVPSRDPILQFAQISEYVIPRLALTHRLVTCTAGEHKILGFPCVVRDERYKRNEFRWNLCFVFGRTRAGRTGREAARRKGRSRRVSAEGEELWLGEDGSVDSDEEEEEDHGAAEEDLSAFEGIVRKCGRILRGCEVESQYLSGPTSVEVIPRVLEQLFEDLNNYSETSIRLDDSNFLELKLFPFFPNPPRVEDWHVPIALVDLKKVQDPNWDISAARIAQHINGINHIAKISQLADSDPKITRKCVQHFLFYQVVMMQDLFQYSNMYTVKPCIQTIIGERDVRSECGAYVTLESYPQPAWPVLLDLYSRLLPGKSILEWSEENDIAILGIDARRFISFGIIKGFLRRVHRWPVYEGSMQIDWPDSGGRREGSSWEDEKLKIGDRTRRTRTIGIGQRPVLGRGDSEIFAPSSAGASDGRKHGARFAGNDSALTLRSVASNGSLGVSPKDGFVKSTTSNSISPGTNAPWSRSIGQNSLALTTVNNVFGNPAPGATTTSGSRLFGPPVPPSSHANSAVQHSSASTFNTFQQAAPPRSRGTRASLRSGTAPPGFGGGNKRSSGLENRQFYAKLANMCDGDHHTDEIQCELGMGWARLEECLKVLGEMSWDADENEWDLTKKSKEQREHDKLKAGWGDYGRVVVILR